MSSEPVRDVLIVGGGTAGWMAASALVKLLGPIINITLVESEEIGTIGVGESTIPHIKTHNTLIGINEAEFVRETQGTFKLGIEFVDWGAIGESYIHGFGKLGLDLAGQPFHLYWTRAHMAGKAQDLARYSFNVTACHARKFMSTPVDAPKGTPLEEIAYAYQFDASLYARYLRRFAEKAGVRRIEGKVVGVRQHENGFVKSVMLASGQELNADLFLDCTGFRGLLIEETLKSGYQDWTKWLPCDRAFVAPTASVEPPIPYTRALARSAGWQWRIPLQHRVGNGYVYSSAFTSDDEARAEFLRTLTGAPLAEPRIVRFSTGHRNEIWKNNVVAIGLSAGFLEPLESTAIHLIQSGIAKLAAMFPRKDMNPKVRENYNRQVSYEFERIRDFLILHYHATTRDDTPFWNHCRTMAIPDALADYMNLFRESALLYPKVEELFSLQSWVQVMIGQGVMPREYAPVIDTMSEPNLGKFLAHVEEVIKSSVNVMPSHQAFIDRFCKAPAAA
jgi:tryptophan 7-halogenase